MTRQLVLTLIAASTGLVSALWFAWPAATSSPHALAWVANPPFDSGPGMAQLMMEQAAQSWVGGILLLIAFVFQIAAALTHPATAMPTSSDQQRGPSTAVGLGAVVVTLMIFGLLSGALYQTRMESLKEQMAEAAKVLKSNPRLTPEP